MCNELTFEVLDRFKDLYTLIGSLDKVLRQMGIRLEDFNSWFVSGYLEYVNRGLRLRVCDDEDVYYDLYLFCIGKNQGLMTTTKLFDFDDINR